MLRLFWSSLLLLVWLRNQAIYVEPFRYLSRSFFKGGRLYQIFVDDSFGPIFDVELEREKLDALSPEELIKQSPKSFPIYSDQELSRSAIEEIKDNILHDKLSQLSRSQIKEIAKLYSQSDLRKSTEYLCEQIIEESRRIVNQEYAFEEEIRINTLSAPVSAQAMSLDEEEELVLKEQGIDLTDLLTLQVQFQQSGPSIFLKPKNYSSKKRFSSSEERRAAMRSGGPRNTAASQRRQRLVQDIFNEEKTTPARTNTTGLYQDHHNRAPLVVSDEELVKLPRRKNTKNIPNLGKLLIEPPADILHGITLQMMIEQLVEKMGYDRLFRETHLRFFQDQPSLSSILKVLRDKEMEWARKKIEHVYIRMKKKESDSVSSD